MAEVTEVNSNVANHISPGKKPPAHQRKKFELIAKMGYLRGDNSNLASDNIAAAVEAALSWQISPKFSLRPAIEAGAGGEKADKIFPILGYKLSAVYNQSLGMDEMVVYNDPMNGEIIDVRGGGKPIIFHKKMEFEAGLLVRHTITPAQEKKNHFSAGPVFGISYGSNDFLLKLEFSPQFGEIRFLSASLGVVLKL